jgi:hypothetical protein
MTDVPADEMVARLRQSLETILAWAELYAPRTLHERTRYDADLDQAEELLGAADAWMLLSIDRWLRKDGP